MQNHVRFGVFFLKIPETLADLKELSAVFQ